MSIGRVPGVTGIQPSIVDAKGDLIVATAADSVDRLAVGANNTVLTADSSTSTGLKWAAPTNSGLVLIKKQTIGSSVSSVTVSDAFSATYDNYRIIITGGAMSVLGTAKLTLGATNTAYYWCGYYQGYNAALTGEDADNDTSWNLGNFQTNGYSIMIDINQPYLSDETSYRSINSAIKTDGFSANYQGFLNNTTSYTAFTITMTSGNMTGGEIRVYGYQNS